MNQPNQTSHAISAGVPGQSSELSPVPLPGDPAPHGSLWRITVNGEPRDVAPGTTVRALIVSMGLAGIPCAAEVNQRLVPRREHETRAVAPGDVVELVSLVGGG